MRTAMLAAMLCILSAMGLDELSASPVGGLGVWVVAARRSKAGMKVVPAAFVPPFAHFHVASRRSVCFSRTLADECCTQPAGTCRREKASVPANQSLRRNWLALRQTVGDEDASGRPNGEFPALAHLRNIASRHAERPATHSAASIPWQDWRVWHSVLYHREVAAECCSLETPMTGNPC